MTNWKKNLNFFEKEKILAEDMVHVLEHLPSRQKALDSITSIEKKEKK
jgi:hypothetical protein